MPLFATAKASERRFLHHVRQYASAYGVDLDPAQEQLTKLLSSTLNAGHSKQRRGLYIYGPPGRGKTLLINATVDALDPATTARFHFHEFFQELNSPKHRAPGERLGAIFAQGLERELSGLRVLVFDEFHCTEPGDAMLMVRLMKYCSEHAITLITTSNYEPERLLDNDVFHHLVEGTIAAIRSSFDVYELDHEIDYRQLGPGTGAASGGYRAGSLRLQSASPPGEALKTMLEVGYDQIGPALIHDQSIWISFHQLCSTRRNTADYLDLARRYSQWHLTDIPAVPSLAMDEERRLANLLDIFYDKDLELHLYTQDLLHGLGRNLHATEQARLTSRLAQLTAVDPERIR